MIIVQRRLGWKNKMILIILKHFIHMETLAFFYRTFSWHILWKFIFLWLIGNISANNLVKYYLPIVSKRPEPIVFFFPSLSLYTFFIKYCIYLKEKEREKRERTIQRGREKAPWWRELDPWDSIPGSRDPGLTGSHMLNGLRHSGNPSLYTFYLCIQKVI